MVTPKQLGEMNYLCSSYWVIDATMMRDMAAATGRDAAKYQQIADEGKAYIKANFINADGTFKTEFYFSRPLPQTEFVKFLTI